MTRQGKMGYHTKNVESWETESFDWNRLLKGSESWSWQWLISSKTGWPCSQEMKYWLIPLLPLSFHFPLSWCFSSSYSLPLLYIFRPHGAETRFIVWDQVSKYLLSICSAGALLQGKDMSLREEQGGRKVKKWNSECRDGSLYSVWLTEQKREWKALPGGYSSRAWKKEQVSLLTAQGW